MPRKKSKKRLYFDLDVQDAIIRYNSNPDNFALRNKIYRDEIHQAFDKLCENIINTFKFSYFDEPFEEVKNSVVAFLVMNIHKYDHTKGAKAFSYFSIVAKNYLILHNNNNYKKYKTHDDISVLDYVNSHETHNQAERKKDLRQFMDEFIEYFENEIPIIFKKSKNINIAYAILEIMKSRDEIEEFNKKALYILIREMTDVKTSDITKVVNIFKKYYSKLITEYNTNGYISTSKNKFF
mgnify:FL=1|tara:strand:+ start:903 stop:1616 length:714 start_codon:yes stop_codon:yes gene_type:complete